MSIMLFSRLKLVISNNTFNKKNLWAGHIISLFCFFGMGFFCQFNCQIARILVMFEYKHSFWPACFVKARLNTTAIIIKICLHLLAQDLARLSASLYLILSISVWSNILANYLCTQIDLIIFFSGRADSRHCGIVLNVVWGVHLANIVDFSF